MRAVSMRARSTNRRASDWRCGNSNEVTDLVSGRFQDCSRIPNSVLRGEPPPDGSASSSSIEAILAARTRGPRKGATLAHSFMRIPRAHALTFTALLLVAIASVVYAQGF